MTPFRALFLAISGLVVLKTGPGAQPAQPHPTCVALAFGQWLPASPEWLRASWRESIPPIRLIARPVAPDFGFPKGWMAIRIAPTAGIDTSMKDGDNAFAWPADALIEAWRNAGRDSIELEHVAALGYGFTISGRWAGDTLHGRAHSFSDASRPSTEPRANVLGIRYPCLDSIRAASAVDAVRRFHRADVPDVAANRAESLREAGRP